MTIAEEIEEAVDTCTEMSLELRERIELSKAISLKRAADILNGIEMSLDEISSILREMQEHSAS